MFDSTPGQSMLLEGKRGGRLRSKVTVSSETESSTEEGAGLPCTPLTQQCLRPKGHRALLKLWPVNLVAMDLLKDHSCLESYDTN